jgi:hypothetical protein
MKNILVVAACLLTVSCGGSAPLPGTVGGAPLPSAPQGVQTDFYVVGRDIDFGETPNSAMAADSRSAAASRRLKFFIHGIDYSPTPIGTGVNNNPLGNGNSAIWSRDIPLMRAAGVNVIHIYNVDENIGGPIANALTALWNNGKSPIFVVFSIHFAASCLQNAGCANDLAGQYYNLDKKYGTNDAILGIAVSNEINPQGVVSSPAYWQNFNLIANRAKQGFRDAGNPNKLVMTSNVDDNNTTLTEGERFKAAVDVWGVNVYRGRGFTNLFDQVRATTEKPFLVTEYGGTAGYHPKGAAGKKYDFPLPDGTGVCRPTGGVYTATDIAQMPATGNISMAGLNDLVTNSNALLFQNWKQDGADSGGFYFEWTDEWWKADQPANATGAHLGNTNVVDSYPACARDEAWYGLYSVARGSGVNTVTPRSTLTALKTIWSKQPTTAP